MDIKEFFRTIQWQATLQIAAIRIGVASIIWPLVFFIFAGAKASEVIPLAFGSLVFFFVCLAVAIPAVGLARANVPFIGLLALPAWLMVVADPLVKILHGAKPEWVPVEEFKLFNPPVLAVFGEPEKSISGLGKG